MGEEVKFMCKCCRQQNTKPKPNLGNVERTGEETKRENGLAFVNLVEA